MENTAQAEKPVFLQTETVQNNPSKKVIIISLVLMVVIVVIAGIIGYKFLGSSSQQAPVPTIRPQVVKPNLPTTLPTAESVNSGTVSASTGQSNSQLNQDSQTIDNSLNNVSKDLNNVNSDLNDKAADLTF